MGHRARNGIALHEATCSQTPRACHSFLVASGIRILGLPNVTLVRQKAMGKHEGTERNGHTYIYFCISLQREVAQLRGFLILGRKNLFRPGGDLERQSLSSGWYAGDWLQSILEM